MVTESVADITSRCGQSEKDTNAYTDEEIKKLFDLLSQRISNLTDYVNGEIAELRIYVDNENKKFLTKLTE